MLSTTLNSMLTLTLCASIACAATELQVVAVDPLFTEVGFDRYGDHKTIHWLTIDQVVPPEQRREALRLIGPRGGTISGQVIASARGAASITDLSGPQGTIPASAVTIRYATYPQYDQREEAWKKPAWVIKNEISKSVDGKPIDGSYYHPIAIRDLDDDPRTHDGIHPIWISVEVPRGTASGTYGGTLSVGTAQVPVTLKVTGFEMPQVSKLHPHVGFDWSYLGLADHLGVDPWSDAHLTAIHQMHALMKPFGDQVLVLPLKADNYLGDEHALIRFRLGPDGLVPDWTLTDRILDLYQADLGQPQAIVVHFWIGRLFGTKSKQLDPKKLPAPEAVRVPVTVVAEDGSLSVVEIKPPYLGDVALWKRVFDELQERIAARGWREDLLVLGSIADAWPRPETVEAFAKIAPNRWLITSHGNGVVRPESREQPLVLSNGAVIAHYDEVWWAGLTPREDGILGGWDLPFIEYTTARNLLSPADPLSQYRGAVDASFLKGGTSDKVMASLEKEQTSDNHGSLRTQVSRAVNSRGRSTAGITRLPLLKPRQRRDGGRFAVLTPYKDFSFEIAFPGIKRLNPEYLVTIENGELHPTTQLLMLLEGLQEVEARVVLERALVAGDLPPGLASEVRTLLVERSRILAQDGSFNPGAALAGRMTYAHSTPFIGIADDWQAMTQRLFDLAGQVQRLQR